MFFGVSIITIFVMISARSPFAVAFLACSVMHASTNELAKDPVFQAKFSLFALSCSWCFLLVFDCYTLHCMYGACVLVEAATAIALC